jgi:hypothetical protein
MSPSPPRILIRSAAELFAMWQGLMGGGEFARSTIWHVFFDDDGRTQSVIMPIDNIPSEPDPMLVRNLAHVVADLIDSGTAASVALLISRDGPATMTEADRRWARALHAAFEGLTHWPVHLATRGRIHVFALDDLIAA